MSVVIDASMALAWVFEREQRDEAERAEQLLAGCGEQPCWVPGLWHLEIANALAVAERRQVISPDTSDLILIRVGNLPIRTADDMTSARAGTVLSLARGHGLSSYDASYLELAQRLGAALASFDRRLNQAAADLGVTLYR